MLEKKDSLRVAVLMGGLSSEREISLQSGKAVAQALAANGWNVQEIDVSPDLPRQLIDLKIDVAWIALHGLYGEDGCVQGLLEVMGIPYTGSNVQACAISMDKISTKMVLKQSDVRLIPDFVMKRGESIPTDFYPCVLKDPTGGSSIGVWICHTEEDAASGLRESETETFLVEKYIQGEEITVAVFDGVPYPVVSIRPKVEFFDLAAKYTKGMTDYIVPSPLPESICIDAQKQAVEAYQKLGMSGIARADFIVTAEGKTYFLEINASPGMTATSLSPMAAQAVGISFPDLVEKILLQARCSLQPVSSS
ncbi:MAG: D-alanine--D-alanine ligase [Myxococcota bacterium]|nr:D-alanine--D-alanine ligase [Myxococcota bacterium]